MFLSPEPPEPQKPSKTEEKLNKIIEGGSTLQLMRFVDSMKNHLEAEEAGEYAMCLYRFANALAQASGGKSAEPSPDNISEEEQEILDSLAYMFGLAESNEADESEEEA